MTTGESKKREGTTERETGSTYGYCEVQIRLMWSAQLIITCTLFWSLECVELYLHSSEPAMHREAPILLHNSLQCFNTCGGQTVQSYVMDRLSSHMWSTVCLVRCDGQTVRSYVMDRLSSHIRWTDCPVTCDGQTVQSYVVDRLSSHMWWMDCPVICGGQTVQSHVMDRLSSHMWWTDCPVICHTCLCFRKFAHASLTWFSCRKEAPTMTACTLSVSSTTRPLYAKLMSASSALQYKYRIVKTFLNRNSSPQLILILFNNTVSSVQIM